MLLASDKQTCLATAHDWLPAIPKPIWQITIITIITSMPEQWRCRTWSVKPGFSHHPPSGAMSISNLPVTPVPCVQCDHS
jgi:hypothetical protein